MCEAGVVTWREVLDLFTDPFTAEQHEAFLRRYPNSKSRHGLVSDMFFRGGAVERLVDFKNVTSTLGL